MTNLNNKKRYAKVDASTVDGERSRIRTTVALAGAAAAVAAAAAAGYYFYASKDAVAHRKAALKWLHGFKKEVMRHMEHLKELDAATIGHAVDKAVSVYASMRDVDKTELTHAAAELKRHWRELAEEFTAQEKSKPASKSKRAKSTKNVTRAKKASATIAA